MAYNVISCQKVAENTQILKIAKIAMSNLAHDLGNHQKKSAKNGSLNHDLLKFLNSYYIF